MRPVIDDLRWEARLSKKQVYERAYVSHPTYTKIEKEGLGSVIEPIGRAIVSVLSEELLRRGKRTEPLSYEELLQQEQACEEDGEEEEVSPLYQDIA